MPETIKIFETIHGVVTLFNISKTFLAIHGIYGLFYPYMGRNLTYNFLN